MASENDVLMSVCEYLQMKKHFFWRNNNVAIYDAKRKLYRAMPKYAKKGVPDIIVINDGFFIGLECKQTGKYLSKEQKEFEKQCQDAGGEYYMVRSIEDVQEIGL